MASRSRPLFDYVTEIDPVMSTIGWKVIGLTYLAVTLPVLGAVFPRDTGTNWACFLIAEAGALVIGLVNVVHFRRMVASNGFSEPPAFAVLVEIVLGTFFAGLMAYAIGGPAGLYRPVIFVPTLLIAMIGNRAMIAVSWLAAMLTVTWVAVASGSVVNSTIAFAISYGGVWGIAAVMVHLLAMASLHSDRQTLGLAEAAGIAARANDLMDGMEQMLPVIADWCGAKRAAAYRNVGEGSDPIALFSWPSVATLVAPTASEIHTARDERGVLLDRDRGVLVADGGDDEVVVIVLEGLAYLPLNRLLVRFNLERMVLQVGILVNRSRYIARLEDLGLTDGLTGLPNRRALVERIADARLESRRRDEPLALAMLDLDEFKAFNDAFGHLAGDDLLREFAAHLTGRLRTADFVARFGGEEFCLLLPGTDAPGAVRVLDELHRQVSGDAHGGVTFSAGVAIWDGDESGDALVGRADRALYAAKAAGRHCTNVDLRPGG